MHKSFRYGLALAFTTFLLLPGCNKLSKATEETIEAGQNLKQEAINIKENVENTVDQVNKAKDSVLNATEAVNQAVTDVKAIGK